MNKKKHTSEFRIEVSSGRILLLGPLNDRVPSQIWEPLFKYNGQSLILDLDGLSALNLNGAAQIIWAAKVLKSRGIEVSIGEPPKPFLPIWTLANTNQPQPPKSRTHENMVEWLGALIYGLEKDIYVLLSFFGELLSYSFKLLIKPISGRWALSFRIAEIAGINSLPVIVLVAFLVGLILAFQSAMFMKIFGVEIFVADLVGLSIIRELGPLMTAIVLTGRSGSAFSAELGTMKFNEEIDAFVTMGLSPVRDLALPRVVALTIFTPLLTVIADVAGLLGGNVVMMSMGFSQGVFWDELAQHLDISDITTGLWKAIVFGFTVSAIGCQRGLAAGSGAGAVGEATTKGVVTNIVVIAVLDSIFAIIFYVLDW